MYLIKSLVGANLAVILLYCAITTAQEEGGGEISMTLKTVENANCRSGDCNKLISTTGSGATLSDGCENTNGTCTGVCGRCNGSNPSTQVTGVCVNVPDGPDCIVEEGTQGTTAGVFTCGDAIKFRCAKPSVNEDENGFGPSECCSMQMDGTQEHPYDGGCQASGCNPSL